MVRQIGQRRVEARHSSFDLGVFETNAPQGNHTVNYQMQKPCTHAKVLSTNNQYQRKECQ